MLHISTRKYFLAIRKFVFLRASTKEVHPTTWMDFKGNVLSEASQRRQILYDLTYICNPKKKGSKIQQIGGGQKWGGTEVGKMGENSQKVKLPVTNSVLGMQCTVWAIIFHSIKLLRDLKNPKKTILYVW